MPTVPVTLSQFGGLNVDADPIAVGATAATDLLNVSFDTPGKLRTRDGYTRFSTGAAAAAPTFLVPFTTGSPDLLIAIGPTQVDSFNLTTGAHALITTYGPRTHVTRPTRYSDGADLDLVFWATENGGTGGGLTKYDGALVAGVAGFPHFVCATPYAGPSGLAPRLVQAGFYAAADSPTLANGSLSAVFFSDTGAAAWSANNWVRLDPGDGELFTGMVAWNGSVYVFKNTKAYQFYSESISNAGTPIFNYRRHELPDPIPMTTAPTAWQPMAVGLDGIYFTGTTGLWRLGAGGASPVRTPIDPILSGTAGSTLAVGTPGQVRMEWVGPQLFIAYSLASAAQRLLVYDTRTGQWSVHSYAHTVSSLPMFAPTFGSALWFAATDGHVYESNSAQATDNGTAISWSWKSGKYPLDAEQRVAITRESSLFGTGTATLTLSSDRYADQSGSVTLGTAPTPAEGWLQKDQEGRFFQHTLSGSGQATVEALTHYASTVKPAGIA